MRKHRSPIVGWFKNHVFSSSEEVQKSRLLHVDFFIHFYRFWHPKLIPKRGGRGEPRTGFCISFAVLGSPGGQRDPKTSPKSILDLFGMVFEDPNLMINHVFWHGGGDRPQGNWITWSPVIQRRENTSQNYKQVL